jgi:hypothetical protein
MTARLLCALLAAVCLAAVRGGPWYRRVCAAVCGLGLAGLAVGS